MDDHGNRAEIARFPSAEEAQRAMHTFEARGHKQTYWVELIDSANEAERQRDWGCSWRLSL